MTKAKKNETDCKYKTHVTVENYDIKIELLEPQIHESIAVIPIKTKASKLDILTVKKGFELGLISIEECEKSTVSQIVVTNNSISPLILVDSDEILGAKQNRIVNNTTLVAAKSSINLSVSCVEQGRWTYKDNFKVSTNIANSRTRIIKAEAQYSNRNTQSEVWNSISDLEERNSFHSSTHAMSESYDRFKAKHEKYMNKFKRIKGQSGAMVFVNGEFEGMDIFINPQIYGEYHKKILKSYIIDKEDSNQESANKYDISIKALEILEAIETSEIKENETPGIGRSISFSNGIGIGSALIYKNKVLHIPFLKHPKMAVKE